MDVAKYRRVAQALAESRRLNSELEERVRQKQLELERSFDALQRLSREAAVVEERRRIMADMHDGIGGQLISTLSLVEGGEAPMEQIAEALRECIDDLRLAIDSLEPTDDDLLPVLGNLRYRLEPRLKARSIELDWQVKDVPKLACLTPQNVLHVLRILQEAFTNVLKHAQATVVTVVTSSDARGVRIDVSDDGRGFDAADGSHGHGLASMRQRARAVGGELLLKTTPTGTTLSLLLGRADDGSGCARAPSTCVRS
jgi:signal transduction histidine kinase